MLEIFIIKNIFNATRLIARYRSHSSCLEYGKSPFNLHIHIFSQLNIFFCDIFVLSIPSALLSSPRAPAMLAFTLCSACLSSFPSLDSFAFREGVLYVCWSASWVNQRERMRVSRGLRSGEPQRARHPCGAVRGGTLTGSASLWLSSPPDRLLSIQGRSPFTNIHQKWVP